MVQIIVNYSQFPFVQLFPVRPCYANNSLFRNHERIANEVRALQLVLKDTTIPVPKLIDHGAYSDGRRYLVTERIDGVTLNRLLGTRHESKAYTNALCFINDIVLPQLEKLKSKERGID